MSQYLEPLVSLIIANHPNVQQRDNVFMDKSVPRTLTAESVLVSKCRGLFWLSMLLFSVKVLFKRVTIHSTENQKHEILSTLSVHSKHGKVDTN